MCIRDSTIGEIKVTAKNERFCIEIPPEGSEYVHENTADNEFISCLLYTSRCV